MGRQDVELQTNPDEVQRFVKRLLNDIHALETMLESDLFETGVRRIGAEQEMFLVDETWRPAPVALEVLKDLDDDAFTTELALFNLEFNLAPQEFQGDCLTRLEAELSDLLSRARQSARKQNCDVILTGILPTLTKSDLGLENMTPKPRYFALNEALTRLRGDDYEFRIKGVNELIVRHDSVMLESCNTSFQAHFQVTPSEFARLYNIAQLITGPLLAVSANSPLLFGKRLWRETRIALFQQAVDTRRVTPYMRETKARVSFGTRWVRDSVLEVYQEDIARHRVLLGISEAEDPFEKLARGETPKLEALCLHNSTVYRWNRPCYGISDGKPHLRIETRVMPAGPSVPDAVANAAFFFGLMGGLGDQLGDVATMIDFAEVRSNFLAAAQLGLAAQFTWLEGSTVPAQELICDQLIPIARKGLLDREIDPASVDRYLGILEDRVRSRRTGDQWLIKSLSAMGGQGTALERLAALTAATVRRQHNGTPVSQWPLASLNEGAGWKPVHMKVEQFMTTDLVTATEGDALELVVNLMNWERVRHIPIEDEEHRLVGLVSYRSVLRYFAEHLAGAADSTARVRDVMKTNPITISPDASSLDAIRCMRQNAIGSLPVVEGGRLVGIVTERDFMEVARELIESKFEE